MIAALSLKERYLVWAAFLANLPDLDILFILILRLDKNRYHRTFSHSFIGNCFIIPVFTGITFFLFAPHLSLFHSFILSISCIYSHLYSDWITSYGTGLFWPNLRLFSMQVIMIFDFVTLIIWYSCFILSCQNLLNPFILFIIFMALLNGWLVFKRLLLAKAERFRRSLSKAPAPGEYWLQPSTFYPNKFYYYCWQDKKIILRKEIMVDWKDLFGGKTWKDALFDALSTKSIVLNYSQVAPREAITEGEKRGSVYRETLIREFWPSFVVMSSHAIWFALTQRPALWLI